MASRVFSGCFTIAAAVFDGVALVSSRRGYSSASAASSGVRNVEERMVTMMKGTREAADPSAATSWVPDPVTGYYRPANRAVEVDAAELRQMLLSNKASRV